MDADYLESLGEAGVELYEKGCSDCAINMFNMIIDIDSNNSDAMFWIGLCSLSSGESAEAIKWFKNALNVDRYYFDPNNYLYMALAFVDCDQSAKGILCAMLGATLFMRSNEIEGKAYVDDFVNLLDILIDDGYNGYNQIRDTISIIGRDSDLFPVLDLASQLFDDIPIPILRMI